MTLETRPSEPGFSGRVPSSVLDRMNEVINPEPASAAFRGPQAKVLSAQFVGEDVNGNKVYKVAIRSGGQTTFMTRVWTGSNFSKPAKMQGTPSRPGTGASTDRGGGSDPALAQAKDQWLTTIAGLTASPFHKRNLVRAVEMHKGDAAALNKKMAEIVKAMTPIDAVATQPEAEFIDPFAGIDFGGGFGSGSGFSGPTYVAPDRRVVEDFVTGALVSLVGNVPSEEMVNQFADVYMTDHRRNFDSPEQEIDPSQSVKEAIRKTDHYQQIHELRPESEDERAWVAQRRQAAAQGGLTTGQQEDFAITQATVGGDLPDVADAAAQRQFRTSGSTRGTLLEDKVRGVAKSMFTRVR